MSQCVLILTSTRLEPEGIFLRKNLAHNTHSTKNGRAFNSLPNGKILEWSKLKAFADDKINVAEMIFSLSDREENIVGKGENAGYQQFLLFP